MDRKMSEIYGHHSITNFSQDTDNSHLQGLGDELSHDSITRALANLELTSKDHWKLVKLIVRNIEDECTSLSIDDLIVEEPHSKEPNVVASYFDHSQYRTVKGTNIINAAYIPYKARVSLDFVIIRKFEYKIDLQGKPFRQRT
jgi:hypothetical protein